MKELSDLIESSVYYLKSLKDEYESRFLGLYRFRDQIANLKSVIDDLETVFHYMTMQDNLEIVIERGTTNEITLEPTSGPKKLQ